MPIYLYKHGKYLERMCTQLPTVVVSGEMAMRKGKVVFNSLLPTILMRGGDIRITFALLI